MVFIKNMYWLPSLALTNITATGYEKGNGSLGGISDNFIKTFAGCKNFGRALRPIVRRAQAFNQDEELLRLVELYKDSGWDVTENLAFESEIFDGVELKKFMARIQGSSEVEKLDLYNQIVSTYLNYSGKRPLKFLLTDRLGLKNITSYDKIISPWVQISEYVRYVVAKSARRAFLAWHEILLRFPVWQTDFSAGATFMRFYRHWKWSI